MKSILLVMIIGLQTAFCQVDTLKLKSLLLQNNIVWEKYTTSHFKIYVEKNKYADLNYKQVIDDLKYQRNNIIKFLGDSTFQDTVTVIIFNSTENINKVLGFTVQGFTDSKNGIIYFVHTDTLELVSKHELTHYYSYKIWGKFIDNFLSEGLSVFYENKWNGHQVDSLTKHIKDNSRLYNISSLIKMFYALNPMIAYPQIGSFTGFLLQEYGQQKLKSIWTNGIKKTNAIYGKSIRKLESEWLSKLENLKVKNIDYMRHVK